MTKEQLGFQKKVWGFYNENKRDNLPWRKKITPYRIWVSEIMLQQTQVDRVIPFFNNWMKLFPTIKKLAEAPQSEVLRVWKGLGYNSRALRMKKAAELGSLPKTYEELLKLPGIGPYTAGAIIAFAYDESVVMIETNIRRVFIHEFFTSPQPSPARRGSRTTDSRVQDLLLAGEGGRRQPPGEVHDREILELIKQTLPKENFREWYFALMDYGSYLGKTIANPNKKSRHYTVQKKFKGSDREIRGKILSILLEKKKIPLEKLSESLNVLSNDQERIEVIISVLEREEFLEIKKGNVWLKN